MKAWPGIITAVVLLAAVSASGKDYETFKLPNGLQIVFVENHLVPIVTMEIVTHNGSFTEPPDYNGLSHLYEHMFFKANAKYPSQEAFMDRVHDLGIDFQGTTHEEFVNYYFSLPKTNVKAGMEFLAAAIMTPKFDQQELEKEREVVLGEFDRAEAQPLFKLFREHGDKLWWAHPERKLPLGVRPVIKTATHEKMVAIQNKYYIPNNSAVFIGGDVSMADVRKYTAKYFGAWKRGPDPFASNTPPEMEPLPKKELQVIEMDSTFPIALAVLSYLGPSCGRTAAETKSTYAADVLYYILSQPTSKFSKRLVESQLVQNIQGGYQTQRYSGPIQLFMQLFPNKIKDATAALFGEIVAMMGDGYFTDEELVAAKHILKVQHQYEQERTSSYIATSLPFWWASAGLDYFEHYEANVEKVTKDDLRAFIREYMLWKNYLLSVGIPGGTAATLNLTETELLK